MNATLVLNIEITYCKLLEGKERAGWRLVCTTSP